MTKYNCECVREVDNFMNDLEPRVEQIEIVLEFLQAVDL